MHENTTTIESKYRYITGTLFQIRFCCFSLLSSTNPMKTLQIGITKKPLSKIMKSRYITKHKKLKIYATIIKTIVLRRPGFDPRSVHVGFVVDKVALGQVFPPQFFGSPLSISFHRCSITWKNEKTDHLSLHLHHKVVQ
jgi:hypothetical protein